MDIVTTDANKELYDLASSIAQDSQTWQGWFCLKIALTAHDGVPYEECLSWVRSIINTHLKDIQGHAYFCDDNSVHILCKPPSETVLEQTGEQMCDIIASENKGKAKYILYDLHLHGADYARDIMGSAGNVFSIPTSEASQDDIETKEETDPSAPQYPNMSFGKTLPSLQEAPKVLLVEDDPITRWMVRNSLKNICDFATASTASKAYTMYSSYQPDVVFLDINLPDKDGRVVLKWIVEHDPGAKVVMFSSEGSLDNITECLNDGASGFVTKPFLREDLLHYVQHRAE